ncbi:superoxide dismutase family protein [Sphingomonas sp. SCN 67-18]|uniref:superoxide dismutase family protein n=1 Tax=uncultured Sphingomonas sp. TaxID=158754 RepID=UPI000A4F12F4|nr:superoxide dismutase family protein [Sphingomonas sp. SCN 67-18]
MRKLWLAAAFAAFVAPAGYAQVGAPTLSAITADIVKSGGGKIGSVELSDGPTGVLVRVEVSGLTPGWHAMHFHAVADCSDEGFQKSGAHINHAMDKKPHGLLNPDGPDFGELTNFFVGADGTAKAETFTALVKLGSESTRANLLDADGSALVIHANADDHFTQPIGGAGARVACAVIR